VFAAVAESVAGPPRVTSAPDSMRAEVVAAARADSVRPEPVMPPMPVRVTSASAVFAEVATAVSEPADSRAPDSTQAAVVPPALTVLLTAEMLTPPTFVLTTVPWAKFEGVSAVRRTWAPPAVTSAPAAMKARVARLMVVVADAPVPLIPPKPVTVVVGVAELVSRAWTSSLLAATVVRPATYARVVPAIVASEVREAIETMPTAALATVGAAVEVEVALSRTSCPAAVSDEALAYASVVVWMVSRESAPAPAARLIVIAAATPVVVIVGADVEVTSMLPPRAVTDE